jgi:hypothetical protein
VRELGILAARETDGRKVIFPVLHEVTPEQARASDDLANRLFVSTAIGLDALAQKIKETVEKPAKFPFKKKVIAAALGLVIAAVSGWQLWPGEAVKILGLDLKPLNGQTIPTEIPLDEGGTLLKFYVVLKNVGNESTGPMSVKLYASDPIKLQEPSSDEKAFKYQQVILTKHLDPSEIRGNFSYTDWYQFFVSKERAPRPPKGIYPVGMTVFYGKGKSAKASFKIAVP